MVVVGLNCRPIVCLQWKGLGHFALHRQILLAPPWASVLPSRPATTGLGPGDLQLNRLLLYLVSLCLAYTFSSFSLLRQISAPVLSPIGPSRGQCVSSVLSIMPKALDGACMFFLDAKDLGLPIRVIFLFPLFITLRGLLCLAGGSRPEGISLRIEGASQFDLQTETFMPVHKAVIKVWVDEVEGTQLPVQEPSPPFPPGHSRQPLAAELPDRGATEHATLSRLPCNLALSAASNSGWGHPDVDDGSGTSLRQHGPPHSVAAGRSLGSTHFSMTALEPTPIVFEALDGPAPRLPVADVGAFAAEDFRAGGAAEEGRESEAPASPSDGSPTEFRIPVRLMAFQHRDSFHSLCMGCCRRGSGHFSATCKSSSLFSS